MSKRRIPNYLRARIAAQAQHRCGYCLTSETTVGMLMEIEHLIPEALGGVTEEENLWLACRPCNLRKSDHVAGRDPLTEAWSILFDPRRHLWPDHFRWTTAGDVIIGITPIGRTTVQVMSLNRPELVRARRLWVAAGWHPPAQT